MNPIQSFLPKVLEKVIHEQLYEHFERNSLFARSQHGFRQNRSTTSALMTMYAKMQNEVANGEEVACASYDQSASFDMCEPAILIDKLRCFGVGGRSSAWVKSFLVNRRQKVRVGAELSEEREIPFGTPQGSILSPLLFLIYTSDMDLWLKEECQTNYCDDTNVAVSAKTKLTNSSKEKMASSSQKSNVRWKNLKSKLNH